jgi:NAD-dependent dihydropyrimidine dehydrogenase PreA subunit
VTFAIGDACVDVRDRSCVEVCPVDCIYTGGRRAYIHPGECIDCGACLPVCPVEAITGEGYESPEHSEVLAANLAFFHELLPGRSGPLGSPGAADLIGLLETDTDRVRSLPPSES